MEVWSNRTQPVQVSTLVQAVQETDDSYQVDLLSRDCYDARDRQQPCPAAEDLAGGGVAGAAGSGDEL